VANIQLKITALGDFSSVNNQLKTLQTQVTSLQKSIAGVGLNANLSTQLKNIQTEFGNALVSSGNFTKQTVQLTSETEKFGQALQKGQLSLGQYFGIITGKSASARASVNALAQEQVKLNNSIVQQDITKQGVYSVFTPTTIDPIAKSVEIAAAKQNIFNLAIKNGSQELINFGKNTQWAGRQLTVGLSMPAILFGSQAVAAFKAVNTELTRLQRLYGEGLTPPSQAQLNAISNQVINLGKQVAQQMGIAQSATVQVAANFAAMGIQGQKLLDVTYQAQRLSKLGAIDATQATNAIVSLQNVYKVSSTDLGNAVNFLSSMQKQTTMSLQDMTDAIPRVGPIMAQLGGGYKDTAVMLLAMREAGVPAAQAANALKSAFASIIAPTAAANKEFASFGINLTNIKNAGTPTQMLMALQSALAPLNKMAQEQLIEKLFGKFQFARISALLDNFGKVGSQTQNALKVAGATNSQLATLAGQEMAQATQSTTAKWQRAIETLKADLYPIGQKIIEVGTKLIDFGQKIADFFNKLPGPIKNGLGILLTLGVLSGPIIMITGLLANLMGQGMKVGYAIFGMIDGTRKWKDLMTPAGVAAKVAMDAMNTGVLENVSAVDTLNAALQRLITSLEALNMNFSVGTGTSLFNKIETAAVTEAASGQIAFPGMATGGYVPGTGNSDTYPAMLTPGEAVIPKAAATEHAPFINAMINGTLPKYENGLGALERSHYMPDEAGGQMWMSRDTNQRMIMSTSKRTNNNPISGPEIAADLENLLQNDVHPMAMSYGAALKLGATDAEKTAKLLDQAHAALIEELKKTTKIFGGEGDKFENFANEVMKPYLSKIETQGGKSNLYSDFSQIKTVRGSGGAEGTRSAGIDWGTIPEEYRGTSSSSIGRMVGTAAGPAAGVKNKKAMMDAHVAGQITKSLDEGARSPEALDEHSPSKKGEKAGKDYVAGLQKGVKEQAPSLWTEGKQVVSQMHEGIDEGLNGSTGTSKIQGIFNKAFGANSRLGGMMSKFSGMGMMGRMGVGMGVGMVGQMASPLLSKLPGGNLITDAMSGASLGSAIPGWGMAAGAAIGLVTGGIKELMAQEKLHKQESEADFKVSSDAVQFMGGQVSDTTHQMLGFNMQAGVLAQSLNSINSNAQTAGAGLLYTTTQLDNFKKMVGSLPKDNTLSLIIQQLKDTANSQDAKKIADEFVQIQMSVNNLNKSQADQLLQLILAQSGHGSAAAGAGVSAADSIAAIKNTISSSMSDVKKFSDFIGQLSDVAINTTNWQQYKDIIDAIGTSAASSDQILTGLINHLYSIGDAKGALTLQTLKAQGFKDTEAIELQKAASLGIGVNTTNAPNKKGYEYNWLPGQKEPAKLAAAIKAAEIEKSKAVNASGDAAAAAAQKVNSLNEANSKSVKPLQDKKKALDAEIKSLQESFKTSQQMDTWANTKEDLKNQIFMAQATGDNLKAQLLQQQLMSGQKQYNQQSIIDQKQSQSDALGSQIADLQASNQAQIDAVNANATAVSANTTATDKNTAAQPKNTQVPAFNDAGAALGTTTASWKASGYSGSSITKPAKDENGQDIPGGVLTDQAKAFAAKKLGIKQGQSFQYNGSFYYAKDGIGGNQIVRFNPGDIPSNATQNLGSDRLHPIPIGNGKYALNKDGSLTTDSRGSLVVDKNIPAGQYFSYNGYEYIWKGGAEGTANGTISLGKVTDTGNANDPKLKKASGGHITGPGSATSDSIPAMLSNGEYVINAGAVQHYGKGTFDALNARHLAKGGVARTNSSITYHRQHMNRISRHFAGGGLASGTPAVASASTDGGIADMLMGSAIGNVEHKIGSVLSFLSKEALETVGISPAIRLAQGKKQSNWDYLGVASMLAGPAKGLGLIPKTLGPLAALLEGADLTQNTFEAAGNAKQSLAGSNSTYNINMHIAKVDSTVDMEKAIHDAVNKAHAKAKMSGTVSVVGR